MRDAVTGNRSVTEVTASQASRAAWQPVLTGEDAGRAWATIRRIEAATGDPAAVAEIGRREALGQDLSIGGSLAFGIGGSALFHAYLHFATQNDQAADSAMVHLEHALQTAHEHDMSDRLYYGFVGLLWLLHHVDGLLMSIEGAVDQSLYDALGRVVQRSPWPGPIDLPMGVVGLGVFGRECLDSSPLGLAILEATVARLSEVTRFDSAGAFWHYAPESLPPSRRAANPHGLINVGMAHGQPGVISFLASASRHVKAARPLLSQATEWLCRQELPAGSVSCFPAEISRGRAPEPSRLAWCYGDPGIAIALWHAARALGRPDLEQEAVRIGLHAAARSLDTTDVRDACLCHGSTGLALMFARLWHMTGLQQFATASRQWARLTLEYENVPGRSSGYWFEIWDERRCLEHVQALGLINGAAGVGLTLLALVSDVAPDWDRVMLLS